MLGEMYNFDHLPIILISIKRLCFIVTFSNILSFCSSFSSPPLPISLPPLYPFVSHGLFPTFMSHVVPFPPSSAPPFLSWFPLEFHDLYPHLHLHAYSQLAAELEFQSSFNLPFPDSLPILIVCFIFGGYKASLYILNTTSF